MIVELYTSGGKSRLGYCNIARRMHPKVIMWQRRAFHKATTGMEREQYWETTVFHARALKSTRMRYHSVTQI